MIIRSCWLSRRVASVVQLVKIECAWKGQPPFAKQDFNYHHKLAGPTRSGIKPLNILQPEGPSFTVSPSPPALSSSTVLCRSSMPWHSGPSLMLHARDADAWAPHCVCMRQDRTLCAGALVDSALQCCPRTPPEGVCAAC